MPSAHDCLSGTFTRQEVEEHMKIRFTQEVYIRLANDQTGFVCTVKYGKLYSKATEFPLKCEPIPDVLEVKAPTLLRKRSSARAEREAQ